MVLTAILLAFSQVPFSLQACDSSMLEILTGTSSQKELTVKMLAITLKLQTTASYLKAFNTAAARKLHQETMENWLSITASLPSMPASDSELIDSANLPVKISRSMGQIRKQIESDDTTNIHELIEACISRISLVSAIINKHDKICHFLEIELEIFELRLLANNREEAQKKLESSALEKNLQKLRQQQAGIAEEFLQNFESYFSRLQDSIRDTADNYSGISAPSLDELVGSFIKLKQHLLNSGYFKNT